ncbi:Phage integrase [Rhodobacterales bacterium HTCC2150]|nr:Phage integrase [Rhodobacterales bacterium HTCC2150] [Rhodobacteraceae bacterium HTCC2150]
MAKNSQKPTQLQDLRSIIEEYVDLKSLNRKPLFEAFDSLFSIVGEKPVGDYTRGDARQYVRVYGSKVKTTSVRRRLNSINAVFNYAIYELALPHRNPFSRILIKGEGKDATTREPFSVAELKKLYCSTLGLT